MSLLVKKGKIIVRDSNGQLVHIEPETKASNVTYGSTTVDSSLSNLEDSKAYTEVDTDSETTTEEVDVEYNGEIQQIVNGYLAEPIFHITLGYTINNSGTPQYNTDVTSIYLNSVGALYDENGQTLVYTPQYDVYGNLLPNSQNIQSMLSNTKYSFGFSVDSEISYEAINVTLHGTCTDKEYDSSTIDVECAPVSTYAPNSEYEAWLSSSTGSNLAPHMIQQSLPEIGDEVIFYFNLKSITDQGSTTLQEIPSDDQDMWISIKNINGTQFIATFCWDYSGTEEVEVYNEWKTLKTTLEKGDGTKVVESKPISGFLEDATLSIERSFDSGISSFKGNYTCMVHLSD